MRLCRLGSVALIATASAITPADLAARPTDRPTLLAATKTVLDRLGQYYSRSAANTAAGYVTDWEKFYWWQSAVLWSTYLDYARYSGDTTNYAGVVTAFNAMSSGNSDFPSPAHEVLNNDDVRPCDYAVAVASFR